MRSRIEDDLDRTDLSTQITKAINRAIEYYESERFWFSEKVGTFVTIANQSNYGTADGAPSDIAEIDYVEITLSGKEYPLTDRSYTYIKDRIGADVTGEPSDFAYYQEKFYFYPIPNAVRTITISYQQKYAELSADGDTNDFTTDAEDLIEARARWWIYSRIIKDQEQANIAKAEEADALQNLRIKTEKLTGVITSTSF
jgi:hypothetical protein